MLFAYIAFGLVAYTAVAVVVFRVLYVREHREYTAWVSDDPGGRFCVTRQQYEPLRFKPRREISFEEWRKLTRFTWFTTTFWPLTGLFFAVAKLIYEPLRRFSHPEIKAPDYQYITQLEKETTQ